MPSSYTVSLRFEQQFTGENVNQWGDRLNAVISRVDTSVAGWLTKALTSNYSLTTANGTADEARTAMLKFTGTGAFTVTIPAVSKRYDVWNACSDVLTISNGSAAVNVQPGETVGVVTDGGANIRRVQPTDFGGLVLTSVGQVVLGSAPSINMHAATKKYVDDAAFAAASGSLPGQSGNAGKFLTTDGTTPSWSAVIPMTRQVSGGGMVTGGGALSADVTLTVTAAAASDIRAGTDASKAATAAAVMGSAARQSLSDAATILFNTAGGYNATVAPSVSGRTIGAPSGAVFDGLPISLEIVNTAGGSKSVNWTGGVGGWDFGTLPLPNIPTTAGGALFVSAMYNSRTSKWDVLGYRMSAV